MRRKFSTYFLLAALCLFRFAILSAQDGGEMSVRDFYLAETDLDANTAGTMMYDQNGEVCAIIKLETSLDGFTFDVGSLGVRDVKRVGGELWIYVPFGIRRITLSHPQLGVIRDYAFPVRIEKARTYIMKLNAKLGNRVYDNSHQQEFILQITPPDARVTINGMAVQLDSTGRYAQSLAFGLYDVTVQREDYHTLTFQQQIDNLTEPHVKEILMKQDYGWLSIPKYTNETVWIDNEKIAYNSGDVLKLKSGHYRISRKLPLYKLHETAIEVKDSVVFILDTPMYELNARNVQLSAPDESEIWVDSTRVGMGYWEGLIEFGRHSISARKRGHRSGEIEVDVFGSGPETVAIPAPVPAYGTLTVAVDPAPAEVFVDGVSKGQAPNSFVLPIGQHSISIRRSGMDTENYDIYLAEGQTVPLDVHLITTLTVTLQSYADDTEVRIDGEEAGKTPFTVKIPAGYHHVQATHSQFRKFDKNIDFNNPGTVFLKMKPHYTHSSAFYIDLQAALPGGIFAGGALGIYAKKFNVEATALYGLQATDQIFWNSTEATAEPSVFTYKPLIAGARAGIEFPISMKLSLTPRVGANLVYAMGTPEGRPAFDASMASAIAAAVDLRFTVALVGPIYLKVQPEYDIKVWQSSLYEELSEVSPTIGSWTNGFRIGLGFSFIF